MRILCPECPECFIDQSRVLSLSFLSAELGGGGGGGSKRACLLDTYEWRQTVQAVVAGASNCP